MRWQVIGVAVVTAAVGMGLGGCTLTGASGQQYRIGSSGIEAVPEDEVQREDQRASSGPQRLQSRDVQVEPDAQVSLNSERDVDTAYGRLKRHFGFQTLEERAGPDQRAQEWANLDRGFHHRVTPGVGSSMRQPGRHLRNVGDYTDPLQLEIDREGNGSRVHLLFYSDTAPGGQDQYGRYLRQQVEAALR
ncbi:hypothetical protein [Ectothiorhodospira variabilis]|uniref:hypothetical protein n=1 Tax=Ectothiorhodospira variabilis TaxID=505694 RepID=UPI001EFB4034|nr:hypothetical protein [Ectothiorhodospira variabilis]MCG5495530.1 hypothetical protein [Ectothiorhodospira variabilis]MCG5505138.1 hypothetical protein [Ectothiorhodospira variabilis]MCG5508295.1 hypothetical protein [Ectothiorhodospira variabilis]